MGGPGYISTCIGTFVSEGVIDQRDKKMAHNDQCEPLTGTEPQGGTGGTILELWEGEERGAFEGGSGSVERDRQNRDLYSNWTKCCENPARRSEQVQHNLIPFHILYDRQ